MIEHLNIEIDPRMHPFRVRVDDVAKLTDPGWRFQTVLWAALAECGCQERRCKNLTATDDADTAMLEFTHGEGRRSWPRERYGQGLTVDLVEWFREIHAYEDSLS
jgi:hypothetical protein